MKYYIDLFIQNNEEMIEKKNIVSDYKNNKLKFNYDDEYFELIISNDNIIMKKENNDSILIFNFIKEKENAGQYFIKSVNSYIDILIKTVELIIEKKQIYIEYNLKISDQEIGIFKFRIDIKEN